MKYEDYINKTRAMVNFLTHTFNGAENAEITASIVLAQADQDTKRLIDLLEVIKRRCESWIEELKAMEE